MSKYVKNLIADHLHERLQNVHDALLVNMIGPQGGQVLVDRTVETINELWE